MAPFRSLLLLACWSAAAVFSPSLDAEISELHAGIDENWKRLGSVTEELQKAGKMPASLPASTSGTTVDAVVSADMLEALRKQQTEFTALQQQAFAIGQESGNNDDLVKHPQVDSYIQRLREFSPGLKETVSQLEREYSRVMGKPAKPSEAEKLEIETFCGSSEAQLRSRAKAEALRDSRPFRSKAMDVMAVFRERQLQMGDKQKDLQLHMDGPDWPKQDWPLSTADAKRVSTAENAIQAGLQKLNQLLEPMGGLARMHETEDEAALEELRALNDMMSCYSELIDRHVDSVKHMQRRKGKKQKKAKKTKDTPAQAAAGSSGSKTGSEPFAWLRGDSLGSAEKAPVLGQTFGSLKEADRATPEGMRPLGGLAGMGSSLGGLSSAPAGSGLAGLASSGSTFGGLPLRPSPQSAAPPRYREWTAAQPVYSNGGEL